MPKDYAVATAQGRRAKAWRNKRMAWDEFAAWMREPRRTPETAAEYAAMAKAERDAAKDGPCYVAGYLEGGRRRQGSVARRSMVVLDADERFFSTELERTLLYVAVTRALHRLTVLHRGRPSRFLAG